MTDVVTISKAEAFKNIWESFTEGNNKTDPEKIEIRTHTRNVKKNNQWSEEQYYLPYYKWSACWRDLIKKYPDAEFDFENFEKNGQVYDCLYYPNDTASVFCKVTILGITKKMWLPVMDFKNKSIANPTSKDINDTKMRCLVKTIALFGLGFDLYDGSYVHPVEDKKIKTNDKQTKNDFI